MWNPLAVPNTWGLFLTGVRAHLERIVMWMVLSLSSLAGWLVCRWYTPYFHKSIGNNTQIEWYYRLLGILYLAITVIVITVKIKEIKWRINTLWAKNVASAACLFSPFVGYFMEKSDSAIITTSCVILYIYAIIMMIPALDIGVWDFSTSAYMGLLWGFFTNQKKMVWPWFVTAALTMFLCHVRNWLHYGHGANVPPSRHQRPYSPNIRPQLITLVQARLNVEEKIYLKAILDRYR